MPGTYIPWCSPTPCAGKNIFYTTLKPEDVGLGNPQALSVVGISYGACDLEAFPVYITYRPTRFSALSFLHESEF